MIKYKKGLYFFRDYKEPIFEKKHVFLQCIKFNYHELRRKN